MTEDEARTKPCVVLGGPVAALLMTTRGHHEFSWNLVPRCCASDCVAGWRISHNVNGGDEGFCGFGGGTAKPSYGYPPGTVSDSTEPPTGS